MVITASFFVQYFAFYCTNDVAGAIKNRIVVTRFLFLWYNMNAYLKDARIHSENRGNHGFFVIPS